MKRQREDSKKRINNVFDLPNNSPKRIKLITTAQYFYQELFQQGKNSDVTIEALGHEFNLHKLFLSQSPYFASMFGGSWLEANKKHITIDVVDPEITYESFQTVLESLYKGEIILNPTDVVSILATATMLQLDSIIDKCREVMTDTINPQSAVSYYNAACSYGDKKLYETCNKWFLINLMSFYVSGSLLKLRTIPLLLMSKLVAHPHLFVVKSEYSVYVMLKCWMFLHLHPDLKSSPTLIQDVNSYYTSRAETHGSDEPFLLTEEGQKFIPVFEGLRIQNLISHYTTVETIERDNIIPRTWLNQVALREWKATLKVYQTEEIEPLLETLDISLFWNKSLRYGCILSKKRRHLWSWASSFPYGVGLLMVIEGDSLLIKRIHRYEFKRLFKATQLLAISVAVATLNEQRQIVHIQSTDIKKVVLTEGETLRLMSFDKEISFPLIISANILYTSPEESATSTKAVIEEVA